MSRSRRHAPVCGWAIADSEKRAKQCASRRHRHAIRLALLRDARADLLPHWRQFGDPLDWPKDGKMRFDPRRYPALLRK